MKAYKETILSMEDTFPVEIFISDNKKASINVDAHWHDCVEVLYILEGSPRQQINEHFFTGSTGDVIIVNYGAIHSTYCDENENCKILVMKFMPQLISDSMNYIDSKYIHMFLNQGDRLTYHIRDIVSYNGFLHQLFYGVLKEYDTHEEAYEVLIKGYILQILGILIRNGNIAKSLNIDQDIYVSVRPVIKYIEENYKENFTMADVAKTFGISYYHFSRVFKEAIGRNFKEYLDYVRITEADKLLLHSQMSISAIAYEVGYGNVSSFNRVYKRIKDVTPSSIRKNVNTTTSEQY